MQQSSGARKTPKVSILNRHKREALVGKILSYYASAGKDPPIGLSASQDINALKKHLEHAKSAQVNKTLCNSYSVFFTTTPFHTILKNNILHGEQPHFEAIKILV